MKGKKYCIKKYRISWELIPVLNRTREQEKRTMCIHWIQYGFSQATFIWISKLGWQLQSHDHMVDIRGNVHIAFRRHHYTSWVATRAAGCASSKFLSWECYASVRCRRAGCYLYRSNSVSRLSGCYTRSDSLTDFHSLKYIRCNSSFIGNDYQKVGYLGKEVHNTPAYSLI